MYTPEQAIHLAKLIKYHPNRINERDQISKQEAISLIEEALKLTAFNWITGQVALNALKEGKPVADIL